MARLTNLLFTVFLALFISCQGEGDNQSNEDLSNQLDDTFSNVEVPESFEVDGKSFTDFHRIDEDLITRKLDILIVPDTSGSIKQERSDIADGFKTFLNSLPQGIETNIGVLLAHGPKSNKAGKLYRKSNEPYVLKTTELTTDVIRDEIVRKIFNPPSDGPTDGGEVGMFAILEAIKTDNLNLIKSQGLFRPDAALAIIFIADEQDICAQFPEGVIPVVDKQNAEKKTFVDICIEEDVKWKDVNIGSSEYTYKITPELVLSEIKKVYPDSRLVIGGAIYDENSILPTGGEDEIGYGYREMINLAGGISIDLANGDYADGLVRIGRLAGISEGEIADTFQLKGEFVDPESIRVSINDVDFPNWTFDKTSQSITLDRDRDLLSIIKIEYSTDSTKPQINIPAEDGQIVASSVYPISFTVDDEYLKEVKVFNNDVLIQTFTGNIIDTTLILELGVNLIRIEAEDLIGNKEVISLNEILFSNPLAPDFEATLLGSLPSATLNLVATEDSGQTIVKYDWRFTPPQVVSTTVPNTSFQINSAGEYSISLTVSNQEGLSETSFKRILVSDQGEVFISDEFNQTNLFDGGISDLKPFAQVFLSESEVILGEPIRFDGSNSFAFDGAITSYIWDLGNGTSFTTTDSVLIYTYPEAGSFDPTLTTISTSGIATTIGLGGVDILPKSPLIASLNVNILNNRVPAEVVLDSSSTSPQELVVEYIYDYGDGTVVSSEQTSNRHIYQEPGTYTVKLRVIDNNEITEDIVISDTVTILERDDKPVSTFLSSKSEGVYPFTSLFDASFSRDDKGIVNYSWDFGDGSDIVEGDNLKTIAHTFTKSGLFTVSLTVTDTIGQISKKEFKINSLERNEHLGNFRVIKNENHYEQTVVLDASIDNSPLYTYQWNINGEVITESKPVLYYDVRGVGTYNVSLTVKDPISNFTVGSSQTFEISEDLETPHFTFSTDTTISNTVIDFQVKNSIPGSTYTWRWGDGLIEETSSESISHTYKAFGEYVVNMEARNPSGEVVTYTSRLVVSPNISPILSLEVDSVIKVPGSTFVFTPQFILDDEEVQDLKINFGDGEEIEISDKNFNLSYSYANLGSYTVTLIGTDRFGETVKSEISVFVTFDGNIPVASFTTDKSFGNPHLKVLFNGSNSTDDERVLLYHWDFGDGIRTTTSSARVSHTYTLPGLYSARLSVEDNQGLVSGFSSKTIRVNRRPITNFNYSIAGLQKPFTINVDASETLDDEGNLLYRWFTQKGEVLLETRDAVSSFTLDKEGSVSLFLEVVDSDGYTDKTSKIIKLNSPPVARAFVSPIISDFPSEVSFDALLSLDDKGIERYEWKLDGVVISSNSNGSITFEEAGFHSLVLTVYDESNISSSKEYFLTIRTNANPVANFSFELDEELAPSEAIFDATSSSDDKRIVLYEWLIDGDQSFTSNTPKLKFTFENSGTHLVTLEVTDNQGAKSSLTKNVLVGDNLSPIASLVTSTIEGELPLQVDFDASSSTTDDEVTYFFDFGDGNTLTTEFPTVSHTYTSVGSYEASVLLTDRKGQTGLATKIINVINSDNLDSVPPSIIPFNSSKNLAINEASLGFEIIENETLNFQTLKVLKNSVEIDPAYLMIDENNKQIVIDLMGPYSLALDETSSFTIRIADSTGNFASKTFLYTGVPEITPDLEGPVFNFNPQGGVLSSRELDVHIFVSDISGLDYSTLEVKLNGTPVSSEILSTNETLGRITVGFHGVNQLPEANFNLVEVLVKDSLGNLGRGELGLDTIENQVTIISNNSNDTLAGSGNRFSCFLTTEGGVRCLGENREGSLGSANNLRLGFVTTRTDLRPGGPVSDVTDISLGGKAISVASSRVGMHSCAILENRSLKCWGRNTQGQLGNGNTEHIGDNETPDSVPALVFPGGVDKVSVFSNNTCVIYGGGRLKCFGENNSGQLGLGVTENMGDDEPIDLIPDVDVGGNVVKVVGGRRHMCALLQGGSVTCWGSSGGNQLNSVPFNTIIGDNEVPSSIAPIDFGRSDVIDISSSENTIYALFSNGEVLPWGSNQFGAFGAGTTTNYRFFPIANNPKVSLGSPATSISSGRGHTCAVLSDGNSRCWGLNSFGQLGIGNTNVIGDNEFPSSQLLIDFTEDIASLSLGDGHSCAFFESNTARCWGLNNLGQLGFDASFTPTIIIGDDETYLASPLVDISEGILVTSGGNASNFLAVINATPLFGNSPLTVNFDASESTSTNSSIVSYTWNLGDGTSLTQSSPLLTHTYSDVGAYKVKLIIINADGESADTETAVNVTEGAILPVAKFSKDFDFLTKGSSATFNAQDSRFSRGSITEYLWSFSNGDTISSTQPTITRIFDKSGVAKVQLTIVGDDGSVSRPYSKAFEVKDLNESPVGELNCNISGYQVNCSIDGINDFDGSIASIRWDMGNGVVLNGNSISYLYPLGGVGLYEIKAAIFDNAGGTKNLSFNAKLDNIAPIISTSISSGITQIENVLNFDLRVSDDNRTITDIYLNGLQVLSTYSQDLNESLVLNQGLNSIRILSRDLAGNISNEVLLSDIEVANPAPSITFDHSSDQLLNDSSLSLNINIEDVDKTTSSIIVNSIAIVQNSEAKNFSIDIDLVEGENTIQVISFDSIGQISTESLTNINLDSSPPQIIVESPAQDSLIIGKSRINIRGSVSENLDSFRINGTEISLSGSDFDHNIDFLSEGEKEIRISATDLAGNTSLEIIDLNLVNNIIYEELISVTPINGNIRIKGREGATRFPNQKIRLKSGLFDTQEITSDNFGAFDVVVSRANNFELFARSNIWDFDQTINLEFNADNTFSGMIKDTSNNPLPGVTVTIPSTGQSSITGIDGIFSISNPPTGDQLVAIDGSTVPSNYNGEPSVETIVKFSKVNLKHSFGLSQKNVLERVVYLAPHIITPDMTPVPADSEITVTSPNISDFSITIPAGAASFPSGTGIVNEQGETENYISIAETPIERASIAPDPSAVPTFVYSLEPSGLQFSQRAQLTLPNVNNFAEGTRIAIFSKNSVTGQWELDGSADVHGGRIVTREGEGISHFSEVYAVPYGLEIDRVGPQDKPGIDIASGGNSLQVALPSFKVLGQTVTPNLIYNSSWAKPNVVVSNFFDLSDKQIFFDKSTKTKGGLFSSSRITVTTKSWTEPQKVTSNLFVSNTQVQDAEFDVRDAPDKAVLSYAADIDNIPSGVYPVRAEYKIDYNFLTLTTVKGRARALGNSVKVQDELDDDGETLTVEPFSQIVGDLDDVVNIQNRSNSEFGRGWKLGLTSEILNPGSSRIAISEASGGVATYVLNDTIETLISDKVGIRSATTNELGEIVYINGSGKIFRASPRNVDIDSSSSSGSQDLYDISEEGKLDNHVGSVGANFTYWLSREADFRNRTLKDGKFFKHRYRCERGNYDFDLAKDVRFLVDRGDRLTYLDSQGAIYNFSASGDELVSGRIETPRIFTTDLVRGRPDVSKYCESIINRSCDRKDRSDGYLDWRQTHLTNSDSSSDKNWLPNLWRCSGGKPNGFNERINPTISSRGSIPAKGYSDGSRTETKFNNPQSMALSKVNNNIAYIADTENNLIRSINLSTGESYTVAGNGNPASSEDERMQIDFANAVDVPLYHPRGVATDKLGNIYFSSERGYIRRITAEGKIELVVGRDNDLTKTAELSASFDRTYLDKPSGIAFDDINNFLYVADTGGDRIVRFDMDTEISTQVGGLGTCSKGLSGLGSGNPALSAEICSPERISLDDNMNLIIVDKIYDVIRRINFSTKSGGVLVFASLKGDNSILRKKADGSFERTNRQQDFITYSESGKQLSYSDRLGNTTFFKYDSDLLVEMLDQAGGKTRFVYTSGKLARIVDPDLRATDFSYDNNGDLWSVEFRNGGGTPLIQKFSYDEDGLLISRTNERDFSTTYSYSPQKRLETITDPEGNQTVLRYGVADTLVSADGEKINLRNTGELNQEGKSINDSVQSPSGTTTTLSADLSGFITSVEGQNGESTQIERDSKGRTIKIANANGFTTFEYDEIFGDLIEKFDSRTNLSEVFTYNSFGNQTSYIQNQDSAEKIISRNEYHSASGLLAKSIDANGIEVYRTYYDDGDVDGYPGQLKSLRNGEGEITVFKYDSRGNLREKVLESGGVTSYQRNDAGNITSVTNSKGTGKRYEYDIFNRVTSVAIGISTNNTQGKVTRYEYSPTGLLSKIFDSKNNVTSFEYNSRELLSKSTSPTNQVNMFQYDPIGNLSWKKDANGAETFFEYNDLNLLSKRILQDQTYSYHYDVNANLEKAISDDSVIDLSYEKIQDRFYIKTIKSQNGELPSTELMYEYDDEGNRTLMKTPYGNFQYGYDEGNRLRYLKNHIGEEFGIDYDLDNRLSEIVRPGSKSEYAYNLTNLTSSIIHKKSGEIISQFLYSRDPIGNRTKIISNRGVSEFDYDAQSQLKSAKNSETGESSLFEYDDLNNRIADKLGRYEYDLKSRRLVEDYNNLYQYDNNGNMIQVLEKGIGNKFQNLIYNTENKLIKIEFYSGSTLLKIMKFKYDALGNRYEKSIEDFVGAKSLSQRYVYDGQEILSILDESNEVQGVFTHSTIKSDDVLAVETRGTSLASNNGSYFYLKDALGSIKSITNKSGAIIQHYAYSSFGEIINIKDANGVDITSNPIVKTSYGFTNREHDSSSGLMYYRARYYNPSIGRFISEDPDTGKINNPITITNKYVYVANNPQNLVDPTGEIFKEIGNAFNKAFGGIEIRLSSEDFANIFVAAALIVASPFIAAASAAVAAFVGGGAIIGAIVGGIVGAAIGGAIGYVAGGVGSVFGGGSFDDGARIGLNAGLASGLFIGAAAGYRANIGSSVGRKPSGIFDTIEESKKAADKAKETDGILKKIRSKVLCAINKKLCGGDSEDPFGDLEGFEFEE